MKNKTQRLGRATLHQQFVRQNAQAIDRGGFDTQNDRAERDRPAAVTASKRKLRRRKIAFRSNEHEDAGGKLSMFVRVSSQNPLQMPRVRLKRTDQLQIELDAFGEKLGKLSRRAHLREPILSALLGCFDRDLLPFRLLLRRALKIEMYDRAIGENRRNFGRADLDRLLHNQVHVLSLRNSLAERDATFQRGRFRLVQFAQLKLITGKIDNLRRDLAPASVEHDEPL